MAKFVQAPEDTNLSAIVFHIGSCKNSCLFCNPGRKRHQIDKAGMRKMEAEIFAQITNLKKRGFKEIEISGNDPVEYEKLPQFIKWLKEDMAFTRVILATHGRNLKDRKLVKRLKDAGLNILQIPVYGSTAGIHDSVTQEQGSYSETMAGIANMIEIAPEIQITGISLILKQNYTDIVNIQKHLSRFCGFIKFAVPGIAQISYGKNYSVKFSEIKPYLIKLAARTFESAIPFAIMDIPYCVFGFHQLNIINYYSGQNKKGIPAFADGYSVPEEFGTPEKHLPCYRVKSKIDACKKCSMDNVCGGFHKNYLEIYPDEHFKPL